jgi:hypothetical protein
LKAKPEPEFGIRGLPMGEKKKSRFIIDEGDIEITGSHSPTDRELKEADSIFDKILKGRKPKK